MTVTKKNVSKAGTEGGSPSSRIDARIKELSDWRGKTLARVRTLIKQADPEVVEEWKWRGVPVWSHGGTICTGETYKNTVKLTFARGASLEDPAGLFNSSLDGKTRRAIDFCEGDKIDGKALKALIRAAVALNTSSADQRTKRRVGNGKAAIAGTTSKSSAKTAGKDAARKSAAKPVKLLSGGNPQIPKGEGDGPVQAYIEAMPDWKRGVGKRLDELIVRAVPDVRKAVKWNSPLYGVEERHWFLGIHCYTKYVKVAFFRGTSLTPVPPGESKQKEVRYLNIREDDPLDEAQFIAWVKQASKLPGERM